MSEIAQLVQDCILYNLSEKDSLAYIKTRSGIDISARHLYRVKRGLESDPAIRFWLDRFTRIGFVIKHKQRIEEIEKLQYDLWRLYQDELARPEIITKEQKEEGLRKRSMGLVLAYMSQIRANNERLEELTHGTPTIAQIKKLLEEKGNGQSIQPIREDSERANQ